LRRCSLCARDQGSHGRSVKAVGSSSTWANS
jgi:hypothetical protein